MKNKNKGALVLRKVFLTLVVMGSMSVFSQSRVDLEAGESILVNGTSSL